MMHPPALVEHRVFVRVINGSSLHQRRNETGFPAETPAWDDNRSTSHGDDARVNENPARSGLSNKKLQVRFKGIDCLFQLRRLCDLALICVNQVYAPAFSALRLVADHKR